MNGWDEEALQFSSIFTPHALDKIQKITERNGKFVHYTSARVAMSIIQNKEVWMRQATTMNDFLEIEYGLSRLAETYKSDVGEEFKSLIDNMFPGVCDDIVSLFDSWQPSFRLETYLTCISEHLEQEDLTGRLSMWRAYGGNNSVALVMNNGPFLKPSDAIKAYTSPVHYSSGPQFKAQFKQFVNGVSQNRDFVASLGRQYIFNSIFEVFRFAALCTKHPGFHEEKEWRVLYSPNLHQSDKLIADIQEIGGVPQRIYKIPLKNHPDEGFTGAELDELISRIIIGPTEYPYAMKEAFVGLLDKSGVTNPRSKVFVSDIPLRR